MRTTIQKKVFSMLKEFRSSSAVDIIPRNDNGPQPASGVYIDYTCNRFAKVSGGGAYSDPSALGAVEINQTYTVTLALNAWRDGAIDELNSIIDKIELEESSLFLRGLGFFNVRSNDITDLTFLQDDLFKERGNVELLFEYTHMTNDTISFIETVVPDPVLSDPV